MKLGILFSLGILVCHAQSRLLTDSRDEKTYKTVQIGSQIWMAENLNYAPVNFSQVPTLSGSSLVGFCYDDQLSNCDKYGGLYMWEIATKVCPTGWHLPSKEEFETLFGTIGGDKNYQYNSLIKGGSSGFNALHGGRLYAHIGSISSDYDFRGINSIDCFWTSSEDIKRKIYASAFLLNKKSIGNDMIGKFTKVGGHSVRCIKD